MAISSLDVTTGARHAGAPSAEDAEREGQAQWENDVSYTMRSETEPAVCHFQLYIVFCVNAQLRLLLEHSEKHEHSEMHLVVTPRRLSGFGARLSISALACLLQF